MLINKEVFLVYTCHLKKSIFFNIFFYKTALICGLFFAFLMVSCTTNRHDYMGKSQSGMYSETEWDEHAQNEKQGKNGFGAFDPNDVLAGEQEKDHRWDFPNEDGKPLTAKERIAFMSVGDFDRNLTNAQ